MDTGEIVALVFILLVLVIGTTFICHRCWKSVFAEMKDAQQPGRVPQSFGTSFRNVLRESFRSSVRRVGSLRRRPEPPRPTVGDTPPVTQVATVEELNEGKSELHPRYMRKPASNGSAPGGPTPSAAVHQSYDEPAGGAISTTMCPPGAAPGTLGAPLDDGQMRADDGSLGVYNPLYHGDTADSSGAASTECAAPSGGVARPEVTTQQFYKDASRGYDQEADGNYFADVPERLANALPAAAQPEAGSGDRPVHPADDAMAAYHSPEGVTVQVDQPYVQSDTYI